MGIISKKITLYIVLSVLLVTVGFIGGKSSNNKLSSINKSTKYTLLDESVLITSDNLRIVNFDPLRQDIKSFLRNLGVSYSFYFEYLPNGVSIRDGEDNVTVAASLMKTPVVMDLYKLAEADMVNLEESYPLLESDISNDSEYGDTTGLLPGSSMTLRQAAQLALHNSDNTAVSFIKRLIAPIATPQEDAITALDITYNISNDKESTVLISSRAYASILKCLYYSCFLSPAHSQELLQYLSGSAGKDRLMSGVSDKLQVAHKVGSGISAQSDCGIFYYPNKPYLICLMFYGYPDEKGKETLEFFKTISQKAYRYVENQ